MTDNAQEHQESANITLADRLREWLALDPEVLTFPLAMMIFSLTLQMTSRFVPEYLSVLGAGTAVVGLYGTFEEIVNSFFPYLGGTLSDRAGSRTTLLVFGRMTALGFLTWAIIPWIGTLRWNGLDLPAWFWVFPGLVLVLEWKELGLGATFALVKDAVPADRSPGFLRLRRISGTPDLRSLPSSGHGPDLFVFRASVRGHAGPQDSHRRTGPLRQRKINNKSLLRNPKCN